MGGRNILVWPDPGVGGLWRGEATSCGFARLAVFGLQKPRLPFLEWDLSD